nr:hypothetical protein [uncultured Cohaesibacter sp.]
MEENDDLSDEERFASNMEKYFPNSNDHPGAEVVVTSDSHQSKKRELSSVEKRVLDEFDEIISNPEAEPKECFRGMTEAEAEAERLEDMRNGDIIRQPPVLQPYDKARRKMRKAQDRLSTLKQGTRDWLIASKTLENAKEAFEEEKRRAIDDDWRKRRDIDHWRAGEGRDVYNASRRKVRTKPNKVMPKEELAGMTAEEREQYKKDKNAEKVWRHARRKAGWTDEQIEEVLPGWWEKRKAKHS